MKLLLRVLIIFLVALLLASWSRAAEVTLTWNEVAGCSYIVYYGSASRQYENTQPASETSCTLDLPPGVYYFAVTSKWINCRYTLCASGFSNEVSLMLSDNPEIATIALKIKSEEK